MDKQTLTKQFTRDQITIGGVPFTQLPSVAQDQICALAILAAMIERGECRDLITTRAAMDYIWGVTDELMRAHLEMAAQLEKIGRKAFWAARK
jgi:hypothetical protein